MYDWFNDFLPLLCQLLPFAQTLTLWCVSFLRRVNFEVYLTTLQGNQVFNLGTTFEYYVRKFHVIPALFKTYALLALNSINTRRLMKNGWAEFGCAGQVAASPSLSCIGREM